MIELLKLALFGFIGFAWVILFLIFLEQGRNTWRMGDKIGASLFFLTDVAVVFMFIVLLIL